MRKDISGGFWAVICVGLLVALFSLIAYLSFRGDQFSPSPDAGMLAQQK